MKKLFKMVAFSLLAGMMLAGVGCSEDYDDDIMALNQRIDETNVSLEKLKSLIESGSVISSVTNTGDGVTITLSDGSSYTLTNGKDGKDGVNGQDGKDGVDGKDGKDGKDGVDGTNGKDAVVWTIGADGYWYQDGVKTNYKAIGVDGAKGDKGDKGDQGEKGDKGDQGEKGDKGDKGEDGAAGKDGRNGDYYAPDKSGYFMLYKYDTEAGKYVGTLTNISWKASGVSAVVDGNVLKLYGVDGVEGAYEIYLGPTLNSLAFIPEVLNATTYYPTTTKPFYSVAEYLDEKSYYPSMEFKPLPDNNSVLKSNVVSMSFRVNPTDAWLPSDEKGALYLPAGQYDFINREVTTRAAGDLTSLLSEKSCDLSEEGVIKASATLNYGYYKKHLDEVNLVAFQTQLSSESGPITSDYLQVTCEDVMPVLVNTEEVESGETVEAGDIFYNRTKALTANPAAAETDAFIKQFVALDADTHFDLIMNPADASKEPSLDLKPLVGLYVEEAKEYMEKLNYEGVTYEFSKPKEYLADDASETNQQRFIELKDGVVTIAKDLVTSPENRTPVIRVDAKLNGKLLASAYIKIQITRNAKVDLPPIQIEKDKEYIYSELPSTEPTYVARMNYLKVNQEIYDALGLNSVNFSTYYDQATYNVVTTSLTGQKVDVSDKVNVAFEFFDTAQTTAFVDITIDNTILTQHTYKNVNGKGAEYKVTITIPSKDKKRYSDVVLTQTFYVKDDCKPFKFSESFEADIETDTGVKKGAAIYGVPENNVWVLKAQVSEIFRTEGIPNIFDYCVEGANDENLKGVKFQWKDNPTEVLPAGEQTSDFEVALSSRLTWENLRRTMTYRKVLVNGEECYFEYPILFVNPFTSKKPISALSIKPMVGSVATVETAPSVAVVDEKEVFGGRNIYVWNASKKALSCTAVAKDYFLLTDDMVSVVSYEFKQDANYQWITNNIKPGTLALDRTTGTLSWNGEGTLLQNGRTVTVLAKVNLGDNFQVVCEIPVNIKGQNN